MTRLSSPSENVIQVSESLDLTDTLLHFSKILITIFVIVSLKVCCTIICEICRTDFTDFCSVRTIGFESLRKSFLTTALQDYCKAFLKLMRKKKEYLSEQVRKKIGNKNGQIVEESAAGLLVDPNFSDPPF